MSVRLFPGLRLNQIQQLITTADVWHSKRVPHIGCCRLE